MMLSVSQSSEDHTPHTHVNIKYRLRGDHLGTRTLLAFCPYPGTLQENEAKSGGLIDMMEEISM